MTRVGSQHHRKKILASRTSDQAWSKGLDAGAYSKQLTAEYQTANANYFQRNIQLSGFFTYPVGSPSQLIRIGGVPLYLVCTFRGWLVISMMS
jgi:hypothetical protein